MNESEFLQRIELADQELAQNQVPIHACTFRVFQLLAPDYAGPLIGYSVRSEEYPEFVGPNLLDKIDDWYSERYGERAAMPWVVGRVPIILRREAYLIRIPRAYGEPEVTDRCIDRHRPLPDHAAIARGACCLNTCMYPPS